jgi:hypothetical protein
MKKSPVFFKPGFKRAMAIWVSLPEQIQTRPLHFSNQPLGVETGQYQRRGTG